MTSKKPYQKEELQMLIDNYDYDTSMLKNSKVFAQLLNRNSNGVLNKLKELKTKGILVLPEKSSVIASLIPSQDISAESFMTTVLNLALSRIDKEEKQKVILKLMSEI